MKAEHRSILVNRAATNHSETFLAGPLKLYCEAVDLSWDELAERLGTTAEKLDGMALCYQPRPESWERDISVIVDRTGADPSRTERLLYEIAAPEVQVRITPVYNPADLIA